MTYSEASVAVEILVNDCLLVGSGIANIARDCEEVAISKPIVFALELRVKQFQHIPSDEFVIAVQYYEYLIRLAVAVGCIVDIVHGHLPLHVDYNLQLLL